MREQKYQKFNPQGKKNLKTHVKKLNIGNYSHDYEKEKKCFLEGLR